MQLCLPLVLLMVLSVCTVAGDSGEELLLSAEAGPWEGAVSSIQIHLQEVKRGKTRQFFGLMGKRGRASQEGQVGQGPLGRRGPPAREFPLGQDEDQGSE
ncbi:PREDICTED: tachykinin-4 [Elephantulus edwardii]|uniref:tachykinin-4 n=1 Tax=Elephantulus edwardii TaxID=28737 RepID=UPI0003F0C793|nr:PREDICTED: tachykinin-4 [Elephantulus edwardii]